MIRAQIIDRDGLTEREADVLQALCEGHGAKQIARQLGISPATVRTHIERIEAKLGAHSLLQTALIAVSQGLVRLTRVGALLLGIALAGQQLDDNALRLRTQRHRAPVTRIAHTHARLGAGRPA